MKVGVVTEIKNNEHRVGLTPDGAARLRGEGHSVVVENGAGAACGFDDGWRVSVRCPPRTAR